MAEENTAKSITVRDVKAEEFIAAYAEVLKNNDKFVVPKWAFSMLYFSRHCQKGLPETGHWCGCFKEEIRW